MGLLAPLYLVGLLAIGLPIILHLIRRTPQGKQMFSTLMFLTPSPPRLTRRSRLTNILLLIIRAAAVVMLALAFMRPFLNWGAILEPTGSSGHRIAIMVDQSASMRRGDLWQQAQREVDSTLRDISPLDEVSLFFFDTEVHSAISFAEWNQADPGTRIPLLKSRMATTAPGWGGTRLGDALAAVVDAVAQSEGNAHDPRQLDRRVVLITDMQAGAHVETLQGHEWPKDVYYQSLVVAANPPGNAAVQWITQTTVDKADGAVRVKVSNEPDSRLEQFTLAWANDKGPLGGIDPEKIYVAPGQSKIVKLTWPDAGNPDRLVLGGDAADFDNRLFLAQPRMDTVRILYLGPDAPNDVNGMRYYLQSALADTAQRHVEISWRKATEPLTDADLAGVRLVVVGAMAIHPQGTDEGEVTPAAADRLKKFADDGGDILWVMRDAASAKPLAQLLGEELATDEVTGNFALISRYDVSHPLFTPFADVRFGDFTKIHFWQHRSVKLTDTTGVLAWFDSGDPYLFERLPGKNGGRIRVMTSGWNPADSQLALSTKYVPLVERILRRKDEVVVEAQYAVNDPIALPEAGADTTDRQMIAPDGKKIPLADARSFNGTQIPGIYHLNLNGTDTAIAVNVAADESRTAPLPADEPDKWGGISGKPESAIQTAQKQEWKRATDLENRQKLWRWLIIVVLGLLGLETVLAGRMARRSLAKEQAVL